MEEMERKIHAQQEELIMALTKARDEVRKMIFVHVCACVNVSFDAFLSHVVCRP